MSGSSHILKNFVFTTALLASSLSWGQVADSMRIDLEKELTSPSASKFVRLNGTYYNTKNWLNPVLHNVFMANNRSEAVQNRVALSQMQKAAKFRMVDLLGENSVDWERLDNKTFMSEIRKYHSIAAIGTRNLNDPSAPVVVMFTSASHNLLSSALLPSVDILSEAGFNVVIMEYPGYGGSLGTPDRTNWHKAAVGLINYLNKNLPSRPIYLMGHSIGAAVALQAAAEVPRLVSGVMTHGGFYNLKEASKDSSKFLLSDRIAPIVATLMAKGQMWDGGRDLTILARNRVPVLMMHGKMDQSVNPRHLDLFKQQSERLKSQGLNSTIEFKSFPSDHEDINSNENYSPYFRQIWQSIIEFARKN